MKNQCVTEEVPTEKLPNEEQFSKAANWLNRNRDECGTRIIPALKEKFGLNNLEAIEAAKRAHDLEYGRTAPSDLTKVEEARNK